MTYTAEKLIKARQEKWRDYHSMEWDRRFREAVAGQLLRDPALLAEVRRYPERLIELVFVVVTKEKKTEPFFLNTVQREFMDILNRAIDDYRAGRIQDISLLVLKGRQQGFTTLVTAYQLARSILSRNFEGFTLADASDNTEAIFENKAKFPYRMLPQALQPTEKFNNRRQLLFARLGSSWSVDTATKNVGRSRTVSFFHGSECAFWECGISPVQAALGEALTKDCIKIYESTANGYNDYKAMWDSGAHINCFFQWWRTPEYADRFYSEAEKLAFLEEMESGSGWIFDRLRWLQEVGLTAEQLHWYKGKYDRYLDKNLIRQEYPCTAQEAFLLSGKNVFDTIAIEARLLALPKPLKTGYFRYDYDGLRISNIRWVSDRNGYIRIFAVPDSPAVTKYCIGGDTAGEGSDFFTGHVLDAGTGQQVAHLKHRFDADQYTRQMYCLGCYYKWALIGIEGNFDSYPIRELERLGYPNQYVRMTPDSFTGKLERRFGFKTTSLTRPTIISRLVEIVREHCELICDRGTLEELLTITRNEKGRIEAPQGGHDDDMMGLAIAHEIREQVVFHEEVQASANRNAFGFEDAQDSADVGDEMTVI